MQWCKMLVVEGLLAVAAFVMPTAVNAQTYYLQSVSNGRYLDAGRRSQGDGSRVYVRAFNGQPPQRWRLLLAGGDTYYLQSVSSGRYLDADPRSQGNGSRVYLWSFNRQPQQRWR